MNGSKAKSEKRRRRSSRNLMGVFFMPTELQAVVVRASGDDLQTVKQSVAAIAADTPTPLQAAAAQLRKEINPHDNQIITAIGCEDVLFQTLDLPTEDPAELRQMLQLQMDSLTPLPVEDVVSDYIPLHVRNGQTRILVAVARKDAINERVAALENAGLPPESVTVDALALFRALLNRKSLPSDNKFNVLLFLSSAAANIIVYGGGQPRSVRSVMLDAGSLADAEGLATLLAEINRTLVSAGADDPNSEVGLLTAITWVEELRPSVEEIIRAWDGRAEFLNNGAAPAPAMSLCLEQAGQLPSLNLLPDEWRKQRQAARTRKNLVRAGIAIVLVYLLALVGFLTMLTIKRNELNAVREEAIRLNPSYEEARRLHAELLAMQRQMDPSYTALELMKEISVRLPPKMQLNLFALKMEKINDQDRKLARVRGRAQSFDSIHAYIGNLQKCSQFESVEPQGKFVTQADGWTSFDIVCTLKTVTGGTAKNGAK